MSATSISTPRHVVIIGGGPAGLTAAVELCKRNVPVTVLEKDKLVGGIARTESYKGYHFDIGGHRFFTKIGEVEQFWKEILDPDFITRPRISRIFYEGKFFDYPLKAFNALANLGIFTSIEVVLSYLQSQLTPYPREDTFEEWVSNRFGCGRGARPRTGIPLTRATLLIWNDPVKSPRSSHQRMVHQRVLPCPCLRGSRERGIDGGRVGCRDG